MAENTFAAVLDPNASEAAPFSAGVCSEAAVRPATTASSPNLVSQAAQYAGFSSFGHISSCVCSRVLLYLQGMDIDPLLGVELALESLRRADAALGAAAAGRGNAVLEKAASDRAAGCEEEALKRSLSEMYALLREKGIESKVVTDDGNFLQSAPSMNRRSMIAEKLRFSLIPSFLFRSANKTRPDVLKAGTVALNAAETATQTPPLDTSGAPADAAWAPGESFAPGVSSAETPFAPQGANGKIEWGGAGFRRRLLLSALIFLPALAAADIMYSLLPSGGEPALRMIITALFAVLFIWISVGFWSSAAGLILMFKRYDRFSLTAGLPEDLSLAKGARTALLFPVYNEDAYSVAAGIRAAYRSLQETGRADQFDMFILSDSTNPDVWVREEEAWYALCREENAFNRIFYRRRKSNMRRKSGNIADFCRRWGANYRYMITFDADSLISGECLVRMVQVMEKHPTVGILQTPPKIMRSRSLIARAQQFANHLYGPLFAAGLQYWQLGDAQYWGHNAIIRIEPFMRYCQLPLLSGKAPLGGEIMSHDFVESAMMRRAGYGVWLAYDMAGSYEQGPPSLIDELIRDRRWCQGNLQHSRLIFTRGFFPTHRALFINGIMSYVSALLWFLFLLASSAQAVAELFIVPTYFSEGYSLFPDWPKYFPNWALSLFSGTMTLLFLPKLFSIGLVMAKGGAGAFGGPFPMIMSMVAEVIVSTLLAPVRMLFHSIFVISALIGHGGGWHAQNRDAGTTWAEALRFHWKGTVLGGAWGWLLYLVNPGFFWWMSPIVAGLLFSVPLSVWSSRVSLGEGARRLGLFLTPVETAPAKEITLFERILTDGEAYTPFPLSRNEGFIRAVVMPRVYSLHTTLNNHKRRNSEQKKQRLQEVVEKALQDGPDRLSTAEKVGMLREPEWLLQLHRRVWELDSEKAAFWGIR